MYGDPSNDEKSARKMKFEIFIRYGSQGPKWTDGNSACGRTQQRADGQTVIGMRMRTKQEGREEAGGREPLSTRTVCPLQFAGLRNVGPLFKKLLRT